MQCSQYWSPAKGEKLPGVSRTKQPTVWVYRARKKGMNRWCMYQNVSNDCCLMRWCADVYISSMQRSITWPVMPPGWP